MTTTTVDPTRTPLPLTVCSGLALTASAGTLGWWAMQRFAAASANWGAQYAPPDGADHLDLAARAIGLGISGVVAFVAVVLLLGAAAMLISLDGPRRGLTLGVTVLGTVLGLALFGIIDSAGPVATPSVVTGWVLAAGVVVVATTLAVARHRALLRAGQ